MIYDGFRALAYIEGGVYRLVSRKGRVYNSAGLLVNGLTEAVPNSVFLDGEIVCLDRRADRSSAICCGGPASSTSMLSTWSTSNGRDLTALPLEDRKRILRSLVPPQPSPLLYADYIAGRGVDLFQAACRQDLKGMVAKHRHGRFTLPDAGHSLASQLGPRVQP